MDSIMIYSKDGTMPGTLPSRQILGSCANGRAVNLVHGDCDDRPVEGRILGVIGRFLYPMHNNKTEDRQA